MNACSSHVQLFVVNNWCGLYDRFVYIFTTTKSKCGSLSFNLSVSIAITIAQSSYFVSNRLVDVIVQWNNEPSSTIEHWALPIPRQIEIQTEYYWQFNGKCSPRENTGTTTTAKKPLILHRKSSNQRINLDAQRNPNKPQQTPTNPNESERTRTRANILIRDCLKLVKLHFQVLISFCFFFFFVPFFFQQISFRLCGILLPKEQNKQIKRKKTNSGIKYRLNTGWRCFAGPHLIRVINNQTLAKTNISFNL